MRTIGLICPVVLVVLLGCASVGSMRSNPSSLPILILEYSDGTEEWGRVLFLNSDSLIIRRMEDHEPVLINPESIVSVYRVARRSSSYPLAVLAGALVMAGTWGAVVQINDGDTSTGSLFMAGAIGLLPGVFAGVKVAEWTDSYRISNLNVIGPEGKLDLQLLQQEILSSK
jgi:hypothetical protein